MDNSINRENQENGRSGDQMQVNRPKFSEVNEYGHEQNEMANAQKQMASQETAGVLDQV
jgi:hypothetical protein